LIFRIQTSLTKKIFIESGSHALKVHTCLPAKAGFPLTNETMKLSNTSEYAIRILSFMAQNPERKYAAKYLVEQLKISDKYLRKILTTLSKRGIIKSTQGREGGYTFQKNIQDIFLSDIIDAVDGMGKYLGCILGLSNCSDANPCALHFKWVAARTKIIHHFQETSLADLNLKGNIKF
jgi:Rrf2 family protein